MQVLKIRSALAAAVLAIVFLGFSLAGGTGNAHGLWAHRAYPAPRHPTGKLEQAPSRPRYNTVVIVTDLRGRVIADIFRCLDLRDNQQSISKINYGLLLSAGAKLICP